MSLFGSLMSDFEEDPIFGQHMRSMRQMNTMMNSMFSNDPMNIFGGMSPFGGFEGPSALTGARLPQRNLMPIGFPSMPNINRLLNNEDLGAPPGASFCSSRVVSMSHGPDGRPQVYQATSSTKTGPNGIRETQRTVQDSRTGVKKMAIGHHIGERAHIIEREQNTYSGQHEERQDFINLDEDEADDFNREYQHRGRSVMGINGSGRRQNYVPAIMPAAPSNPPSSNTTTVNSEPLSTSQSSPPQQQQQQQHVRKQSNPITSRRAMRNVNVTSRRPLRTPTSSPLAMPNTNIYARPTTSVHPHPYNPAARRTHRPMKGQTQYQPQHTVEIEEIGSEPYNPQDDKH